MPVIRRRFLFLFGFLCAYTLSAASYQAQGRAAPVAAVPLESSLTGDALAPVVAPPVVVPLNEDALHLDHGHYEDVTDAASKPGSPLGGAWFAEDGVLVVAIRRNATSDERNEARVLGGPNARLVSVEFSYRDLVEVVARWKPGAIDPNQNPPGITNVGIDIRNNRVEVGLDPITDASRADVAALFGPAAVVLPGITVRLDSGPDSNHDRYPYTGGAGFAQDGAIQTRADCATAFSMLRGTSQRFQLTAGHCQSTYSDYGHITTPASISTGSAWTNIVGSSSSTYPNSICSSTGSSCDIGSTKYGDIAGYSVTGNEASIWSGGVPTSTRLAVTAQETSNPYIGEALCVQGAGYGQTCGLVVAAVDELACAERNVNRQCIRFLTPLVRTNVTVHCTQPGDSGGAVFHPNPGIRASGVHSGAYGYDQGVCDGTLYTSLYYPRILYSATVLTQ